MPSSPIPARPRLAEHASARRHHVRGEEFWVLHDERSGMAYRLGTREWGLLGHADGTRDLDGIVAAASRNGTFAKASTLLAFLEALHDAGLLDDGIAPSPTAPEPSAPRPLEPLPGFTLVCDGAGSCCRLYATVMFRPLEEATARSLLPRVFEAGDHPERAFAPVSGSAPCGATSVGFVDGHCVYLESSGRCGLHAAGGPTGKPLGCRMFPALFVDDGQAVRVTPAVECACVLASLRTPGQGSALVPDGVLTADQLDDGIHVIRLPDMILVTSGHYVPRHEIPAWSRAVAFAPPVGDAIGAFLSLASKMEARGLDPHAAIGAMFSPFAADPDAIRASLGALIERARRRLQIDATWRSEDDLARKSVRWILDAATLLVNEHVALSAVLEAPPSAVDTLSEAFYLRAGAFGHQFVLGDVPLAHALRDRAVRLTLARALPLVISSHDRAAEPVLRYPLALVEATLRGHGLLSRGVLL